MTDGWWSRRRAQHSWRGRGKGAGLTPPMAFTVVVRVSITASTITNLVIDLISPSGTTVVLFQKPSARVPQKITRDVALCVEFACVHNDRFANTDDNTHRRRSLIQPQFLVQSIRAPCADKSFRKFRQSLMWSEKFHQP